MVGERLRQTRTAAGLSLEALAAKLEHPVSRQALSKYETGASQPSPRRLADIANALNVPPSSLLTETSAEISSVAFRKLSKLSKSRQNRVKSVAEQRLAGEIKLRGLFQIGSQHNLPGPIDVHTLADCEYAAASVRMRWNLGDRPVNALIAFLEDQGVTVVDGPEEAGFDGLSGWVKHMPVIVLNKAMPPDRTRLSAAHELGHLVMRSTGDEKQDEEFAFRFAAAFLVPAESARYELGNRRRYLEFDELGLLKQRWGMSMQGWIRRTCELGIISDDYYRRLNIQFRKSGWHRIEPFPYKASESPALFQRLMYRALAEQVITQDDAKRFCPDFIHMSKRATSSVSLRELALRSLEERHSALENVTPVSGEPLTDTWRGIDGERD